MTRKFENINKYECGLDDAWEAARKIVSTDGYTWTALENMFDTKSLSTIFNTYTASEAIEKILKYEEKQTYNDKIVHVGDEIYSELTDCKAVVQHIDAWNRYQCFIDNGDQFIIDSETFNDYWVKTGRSYPQIAEVLKQMKESEA